MPTAWVATWGSGKPVIALGSDIDGIPQASQKPGVAYHAPMVEGAPGHGEGHNSGQPLNITAAIAVKKIMEREKLPGTIRSGPAWPKSWSAPRPTSCARACSRTWTSRCSRTSARTSRCPGATGSNGLISVEYTFLGHTAHAAGAPWRGRSALDAVELMNIGWNYRREHLRLQHRSHYVITDGGDQPNVVPPTARSGTSSASRLPAIKELCAIGDTMAQGAAMMTGTTLSRPRPGLRLAAALQQAVAEAMYENIKQVGLPKWSEADQRSRRRCSTRSAVARGRRPGP